MGLMCVLGVLLIGKLLARVVCSRVCGLCIKIPCNAKRKLNTVPLLPSFFHFSNPGRVGVEPHFTDRSRCVRFTKAK